MSKEVDQDNTDQEADKEPLFSIGEVIITRGAVHLLGGEMIDPSILCISPCDKKIWVD